MGPYGQAAESYYKAGWCPLPLPAGQKYPPPTGYTGRGAPYLSYPDVFAFVEEHGEDNIAVRMPVGVVGLDVDDYGNKAGAATGAELAATLGELPATWRSTSRGTDNDSGIWFFRVPTEAYLKGVAGPGIEVIQADHRYAVVAPSTKDGRTYAWYDQQGLPCDMPKPDELPELPAAWLEYLSNDRPRVEAAQLGNDEVEEWMASCRPGPMCPLLVSVLNKYNEELVAGKTARHDAGMNGSRALVAFGGEGHAGARDALLGLRGTFLEAVGAERGLDEAEAEFRRLATGAVRLAAAASPQPAQACACGALSWTPAPVGAVPVPPAAPSPQTPVQRPEPREVVFFGATDDGMALALVEHHGDRLRFVIDGRKMWLVWDGQKWAYDDGDQHREGIKALVRGLPTDDKGWAGFRKKSLGAGGVSSIARMAQSDPRLVVSVEQLDQEGWLLNTPAGIVDLRTGAVTPHDPTKLITKVTPVAPDHGADRTAWLDFLAQTFGGDDELVGYVQRLVGYSATGVVGAHVLPFCHGSGANGKGTFLEAVAGVLGLGPHGYATTSPNSFLMARSTPGHDTEIARLQGKRMVLCSEVNENDRFDEAKVKQLTGGDTLTARYMHKDFFTFRPSHHLWLMGNDQPAVKSGGPSFWRRLSLVPFEHTVLEGDRVDDLQGLLVREHGPAILAWVIEGAVAYHERGLMVPSAVRKATAAYAEDQDQVGRFVTDEVELGGAPAIETNGQKLYDRYEQWCRAQGEEPVVAKMFGKKLKATTKVETRRSNGVTLYIGLRLRASSGTDASWGGDLLS